MVWRVTIIVLFVFLCVDQNREAHADETIAASIGAGALGVTALIPAIANGIATLRGKQPTAFWTSAGYATGAICLLAGIVLASFGARTATLTTEGFERDPTVVYGAAGGLIAASLVTLGLTANASQFGVQRVKPVAAYGNNAYADAIHISAYH